MGHAVLAADRAQPRERAGARGGGRLHPGVGEDHDELVAAVAGDAVEGPELAHQGVHDAAQQRVAGRVTVDGR